MSRTRVIFDRNQIIDIAFAIVKEEGSEALSSRRVCKELNVSSMTIYNYVGSMDEIKREVVLKIFDVMYRRIFVELKENRALGKDNASLAKALAMSIFDFACENPNLFLFLYTEQAKFHNDAEVRQFYKFYTYFQPKGKAQRNQRDENRRVALLYEHTVISLIHEHIWKVNVLTREEYAECVAMYVDRVISYPLAKE